MAEKEITPHAGGEKMTDLFAHIKTEGFYSLPGTGDGCLCGWYDDKKYSIHVHCYKSSGCDVESCVWAGIHIDAPTETVEHLIEMGDMIRAECNRPDMDIKIVVTGIDGTKITSSPEPEEGFTYYEENGERISDFHYDEDEFGVTFDSFQKSDKPKAERGYQIPFTK